MRVQLDARISVDHDSMNARTAVWRMEPIRGRVSGEPRDVFHGDHRNSVTNPFNRELHGGHLSRLHRRHLAFDPFVGVPRLDALSNLIELDAQLLCGGANPP